MNRAIAILLGTLLVGGLALGQALPNPFDVGLGVRAMGLGGAYTALAEGTEALLYNPAGLATLPGPRADSSYSSPMGLYSVTWLAGAFPGIGGGVAYLSAGGITDPTTGDPLAFSHLALVAGVGMSADRVPMLNRYLRLPFPLTLGLGVKYDRVQMATESISGRSLVWTSPSGSSDWAWPSVISGSGSAWGSGGSPGPPRSRWELPSCSQAGSCSRRTSPPITWGWG